MLLMMPIIMAVPQSLQQMTVIKSFLEVHKAKSESGKSQNKLKLCKLH